MLGGFLRQWKGFWLRQGGFFASVVVFFFASVTGVFCYSRLVRGFFCDGRCWGFLRQCWGGFCDSAGGFFATVEGFLATARGVFCIRGGFLRR